MLFFTSLLIELQCLLSSLSQPLQTIPFISLMDTEFFPYISPKPPPQSSKNESQRAAGAPGTRHLLLLLPKDPFIWCESMAPSPLMGPSEPGPRGNCKRSRHYKLTVITENIPQEKQENKKDKSSALNEKRLSSPIQTSKRRCFVKT